MRTRMFPFLLSLLILVPRFALGAELVGTIVRVIDGDTLILLDSSKTQSKIRLGGIDCPEKGRPLGQRAREGPENNWPQLAAVTELSGEVAAEYS